MDIATRTIAALESHLRRDARTGNRIPAPITTSIAPAFAAVRWWAAESANGPRAARIIAGVGVDGRTRVIGTFTAMYVTRAAYRNHPSFSERIRRSSAAKTSDTRTSCQRYAVGVHSENGAVAVDSVRSRATISTPKRL